MGLNRVSGSSDQALRPSASIVHRFSALLASPANLQLKPMIAMGSVAGSGCEGVLSMLPIVCTLFESGLAALRRVRQVNMATRSTNRDDFAIGVGRNV